MGELGGRWTTRLAFAQQATVAEVIPALARRGVRTLVIKGAVTARLIGVAPADRPSADLDLMVAESSLPAARAVLESLGFRRLLDGARPSGLAWSHAEIWTRGDPFAIWIDLHHTLPRAPNAEVLFEALSRDARTVRVGPTEAETPSDAASAVILVLHAAQHAHAGGKAHDDLESAVATLPDRTWREAASLAEEAGLGSSFAFGLRLVPGGAALADRVGAHGDGTFQDRLRASGSALAGPIWIHRLRRAPTAGAAASVLYNALLPSPAAVRANHPEVGSSRMRLGAHYLRRLLRIPRALIHYARARRGG